MNTLEINKSLKSVDTQLLKRQFNGKGEVKGFRFNQLARNDFAVIYEKRYLSTCIISYEVFELKINTRFNSESYPTSKAFGVWAWEVATLEKALQRMKDISIRVKARQQK